jgi:hypothetical protein
MWFQPSDLNLAVCISTLQNISKNELKTRTVWWKSYGLDNVWRLRIHFHVTFVYALDILLAKLTSMCDIFVHYNRVFGTDIGYRKLKALKNAEVEYNSEQKKHWWNGINCEYLEPLKKLISKLKGKIWKLSSSVFWFWTCMPCNLEKFSESGCFWDGFSLPYSTSILLIPILSWQTLTIVGCKPVEWNERDNLFTC